MKRFDTRTYSVSDFIEWRDRGLLDFSPDFQRRYVWSDKAKSYLADTVVRELPMPKLIISQTFAGSRQVRVLVDGQQRVRTLLEFYDNNFAIKRMHNPELAGRFFHDLPEDTKQTFLKYELGVDVLFDASYEELIEIFARINTYTVKLNAQELRNALYLGYFKQYSYSIGKRYAAYWLASKVLRAGAISRMAEAELASNLIIACLGGIASNKSVDAFYRRYEDDEGELPRALDLFDSTMSVIGEIYPAQDISKTVWSGEPMFYSLFCAVRNSISPLPVAEEAMPVRNFPLTDIGRLKFAFDSLSAEFKAMEAEETEAIPADFARFIDVSRKRTADAFSRLYRTRFASNYVATHLGA